MTDADLIYNACLRAERRAEVAAVEMTDEYHKHATHLVQFAVRLIREEIGNGLSEEHR